MDNNNPAPGNNPGLANLLAHISEVQFLACRLSGVVSAIACLEN